METWHRNEGVQPRPTEHIKAIQDADGILWTRDPEHLDRYRHLHVHCVTDEVFATMCDSLFWQDQDGGRHITHYLLYDKTDEKQVMLRRTIKSVLMFGIAMATFVVISSMALTVYILINADKIVG